LKVKKAMKRLYGILIYFLAIWPAFSQVKDEPVGHYLFPRFEQGSILMNDGQKYEVLLNYNTLTEEMVMENDGKKLAIARTEAGTIDTVYINDRRFITREGVFIELMYKSAFELYAEHACGLKELGKPIGYGQRSRTTSITNYSSFSGWDKVYDLKLPDTYEIVPEIVYWLKKNGEFNRISSLWELRKLYKVKKKILKGYIKENDVKYDDKEGIINLIEYLESK